MWNCSIWPVLDKLKPEFISNIKFFCVFGVKGNEVIIVTKNNKVFAFGDNKHGCLGLGHNNAVNEPENVNELCDQQIIDISYGNYHVLALTKSGKCFSWGFNDYGMLGHGTIDNENKPKLINALLKENVIQIVCGYYHSFVLTKSGDLYGFGNNVAGQIGCGNNTHQSKPIKINGFHNEKIVSIACGNGHSLVLTEIGHIYCWGYNAYGQLGLGDSTSRNIPQKLDLKNNETVESISCGFAHSLFLTTDGDIYAFGLNNFGQIGNGKATNELVPVKINGSQKFKEIASNDMLNISIAKAVDDYCYVWGETENVRFSTPQKTDFKSIHEIFLKYSKIKITPKPIHSFLTTSKVGSYSERPLETMLKLFNNPQYSDLKFKIEDKHIYVHKCILGINCKYFESKLTDSSRAMRESTENKRNTGEIEITEYSYDVFYAFLRYLYTDCIEIEAEKAMDLFVLANDYKEEKLKLKCIDIIKTNITIENICSFYCASIKYNLSDFEDFCFNFAVNKMNQIFITEGFRQMDEKCLKNFLERAAKNSGFKD
jgi:RCC1 and BTB domain-containing protein